jgi:enoyl-CoA hydratase/carnithine racemase
MSYETISYVKGEGVGTITLNRAEKLNAIDFRMLDELWSVLQEILADDEVRVLLLTGAGRYFSAGADLEILSTLTPAEFRLDQHRRWNRVFNELENLPKLTVAALNGPAVGGGVELALCCDLRYAQEGSTMRLPQIDFGLVPDAGATVRVPRLIGPARAMEFILSGEPMNATEALSQGLVNRVFPTGSFQGEVRKIAVKMAGKPSLALGVGKRLIRRAAQSGDVGAGLEEVMEAQSFLITTQDYQEGVRAFRERRPPRFRGR